MTTKKPKWWESWILYSTVGVMALLVSYVSGYFLLGDYSQDFFNGTNEHVRQFEHNGLRMIFVPMAQAEANIRGETVILLGPAANGPGYEGISYEPDQ